MPQTSPSIAPRLNSSTLVIGETKAGKTTLLATAAEYLWETYRKVLFLYSCDLGGFSARVEQRIRQGLIRPWRMRTRDDQDNSLSFETLQLASKGWWPAHFLNPLEGEVEPGCRMVPPIQTRYAQTCTHCGTLVRDTTIQGALNHGTCPQCRRPVSLQSTTVERRTAITQGFELRGSCAFDSLTSISDWYLQDMSHRDLGGEKDSLGGVAIWSGGLSFRGNNRAQVGMAQTRVHELVANSLGIPNLVLQPIWTAIPHESSDETGRLTIIGPKLAGDAKTYIAPSWFGNCLEAQVVPTDHPGRTIRRLYLTSWVDEYNRRHLCGHRGDPRFMPQTLEDPPIDANENPADICLGFSLSEFYARLEDSIQQGMAADKFEGPGLASIPESYGDGSEESEPGPARPGAGPRTRRIAGAAGTAVAAAPATPTAVAAPPARRTARRTAAAPAAPAPSVQEPEAPEAPETPATVPETPEAPETPDEAPTGATAAPDPGPSQASSTPAAAPTTTWARPAGLRPPRAPQTGPAAPGGRPLRPAARTS